MTPTVSNNGGLGDEVKVNYDHVNEVANLIIKGLAGGHTPVGLGILGSALVILRLTLDHDLVLPAQEEIKFVQDLTDWVGAYFDTDGKVN